MNWVQITAGFVELLLSIIVGILFIYGAFQLFKWLTKDLDEVQELKSNNIAVGLFYGAVILSVCLMVKEAIAPAIDTLIRIIRDPDSTWKTYLVLSGMMLAQVLISGILAFTGIYVGIRVFMGLTKDIEEIQELKKNNVAIAVILVAIIFSISLFIAPGLKMIMQGLLPFPPVQ